MTATLTRPATMTQAMAHQITVGLIREHGLVGWKVKLDNARRRAGLCDHTNKVISLSKHLMAIRSYEDTMMTITHELAHALVGPRHGHDAVWAAKHRSLGGNGKRCFQLEEVDRTAPWLGTCDHGKQFARYRQPKRLDGWRCRCTAGASPVVWKRNR
ncbi:SprT-like domain-containing protein [Mycolicibacterium aichiense]|uniref:SprT-like domain-containing protein n=1 Tax=Mycolicibacterium aichiense TaxID=1799 RepID=A0AAD1HPY1_9MYCO|nr:SprT-like domain-containing protein [Mycolicibacterium aichiense]MCV7016746.1 hypothetical protein [Mycolicibacterium aichiense]QFG08045.1 SprT-like protease [Mycobacterium phage Herbertwm]BBX09472.1 hypothetical protein MAIC_42750 [Mycolicibacterium aichiense]SUA14037.1 SprT-like family [Mycolicibacterium aichiense]